MHRYSENSIAGYIVFVACVLTLMFSFLALLYLHVGIIKLKDNKIRNLTQQFDDERINHNIDRGRLDVICENHPSVCQEVE